MRVCVVGASGKLGKYMVRHALDRGYEVVGVCREKSVGKLAEFDGRIDVVPGATDDREVIRAGGRGLRRGARRARPAGGARVLVGNGSGGARPRGAGGTAGVLVRVAHHPRWPGRLLVADQGARPGRRPSRTPCPPRRPRRPGGGVSPGVRQRHAVDRRSRERPRGGREPGPARVEPARRRPHPREQPHAPRGLRPVHGGGPRERRSRSRGPGHRRAPEPFGARARRPPEA